VPPDVTKEETYSLTYEILLGEKVNIRLIKLLNMMTGDRGTCEMTLQGYTQPDLECGRLDRKTTQFPKQTNKMA